MKTADLTPLLDIHERCVRQIVKLRRQIARREHLLNSIEAAIRQVNSNYIFHRYPPRDYIPNESLFEPGEIAQLIREYIESSKCRFSTRDLINHLIAIKNASDLSKDKRCLIAKRVHLLLTQHAAAGTLKRVGKTRAGGPGTSGSILWEPPLIAICIGAPKRKPL